MNTQATISSLTKVFTPNAGFVLTGAFVVIIGMGVAALIFASTANATQASQQQDVNVTPRGLKAGIRGEQAGLRAAATMLPAAPENVMASLDNYAAAVETRNTARIFEHEMTGELAAETVTVAAEVAPVEAKAAEVVAAKEETVVKAVETTAPVVETGSEPKAETVVEVKEESMVETGLMVVENSHASARDRYQAWEQIAPALNGNIENLRRAAALIGTTGNLPLEWKIAHRLCEITGQDFGLDAQAWMAYLAR